MDHSQHEQYRDESAWEVRQLRLELEAIRKGEEYIRPPRYTVTQKGKEGGSAITKDKLVTDLLSSLNTLLEIKPNEEVKPKSKWVGLTQTQVKLLREGVEKEAIKTGDSIDWVFYTHINEALREKNL